MELVSALVRQQVWRWVIYYILIVQKGKMEGKAIPLEMEVAWIKISGKRYVCHKAFQVNLEVWCPLDY